MPIESGTTSWWRNRNLMFLAMFVAFAAYFAYDGFYSWPAKNIAWAGQAMGNPPPDLRANPKVCNAVLAEVNEDLQKRGHVTFSQLIDVLKAHLGEPSVVREDQHWWVGPAAYVKVFIQNGKPEVVVERSKEHEESSIAGQKWFALGLAVLAGLVALNLVRIMTTRVVLDESGLRYNRTHVSWDAMSGLRADDYSRKGWVYLEYTAGDTTRSMRLDSFHIAKFKEILTSICERKGFVRPPLEKKSTEETGGAGPTQA